MDVGEWLRSLGLEQYEAQFRANRIDDAVLPRLTVDDLREIGVSAVGDRRRLIDAIGRLPGSASISAQGDRKAAPSAGSSKLSAERRPITVMFCDLVGSTSLAAKLDAEDWRDLVNAYFDEATKAVTELGGQVQKRLGDGLMALFGYPQAEENDAERAVRAALAIQESLAALNARNAGSRTPQLIARIGLDSGAVVVDALGEIYGDAPNVAARVQAISQPGTVLATATVQRQTAGLFIVQEEGAHRLRGVLEPVTLYRMLRWSGGHRRKGARLLTPFVGREEDLDVLHRRWERALGGEGQFVQIVGEAGIGKSRLVEEFRTRLGETPHTWIEWSGSQLLQNTPLHPVAEWGRARFGGPEVPPDRRFAELELVLTHINLGPTEYAPLLASFVDIPVAPERRSSLTRDEFRQKQSAAMAAWALAAARAQPLVLLLEDLQWFDPTSIDLIRGLSERGGAAPLLVVATARPEFRPSWSLRSHHSVISLTPLGASEVQRMIAELASQQSLSPDLINRVSDRAGGIPLFVEEVTRLLLESGGQGLPQSIPPTLRQSLAARLDRLGSAREIARIGAVLGRDFSYALLRDVACPALGDGASVPHEWAVETGATKLDEAALGSALHVLVAADLLTKDGSHPARHYRFKHALIQDAAYDSLLKSRRMILHRRAAEALIRAKAEPEAIARHLTAAGADDVAIDWWGRAGDDALRRSAFKEAIAHLGKAIAMADKAEAASPAAADSAHPSSRRLKLYTDYGHAAMWLRGFAADEMSAAYARALEFIGAGDDAAARFIPYYADCLKSFMRGEHRKALQIAETFLREAEGEGRATEAGVARRILGFVLLQMGDAAAARAALERVLGEFDRERDRETLYLFGNDTEVSATNFLALTQWHLGESDAARRLIERSTLLAAELGHAAAIASALFFRTVIESRRGDIEATRLAANSLITFTADHNLKTYADLGPIYANWARGRLSDLEEGSQGLRKALESYLELGNKSGAPSFFGLLAELEAERQNFDETLALIEQGLAMANDTGEHFTDAYLHHLRGETLLLGDPTDASSAEAAFLMAIAIARRQDARSYELISSLSLARLYQSTGRQEQVSIGVEL